MTATSNPSHGDPLSLLVYVPEEGQGGPWVDTAFDRRSEKMLDAACGQDKEEMCGMRDVSKNWLFTYKDTK